MSDLGPLWIRWPFARIRRDMSVESGVVSRFVYQLEYDINAEYTGFHTSEWRAVARFDHDPDQGQGHDIREEGLHLDIYRDEEKDEVRRGFPSVDLNNAPRYCENYLLRNAERLLKDFEEWHGIDGPFQNYSSP